MWTVMIAVAAIAIPVSSVIYRVWLQAGQRPKGVRRGRVLASEHNVRGSFVNAQETSVMTGMGGASGNGAGLGRRETEPERAILTSKSDLRILDRGRNIVVWLGHSSVFVQVDGRRFLFDPVLNPKFPADLVLTPFLGSDIYSADDIPEIDELVITHDHWDHLDYGTVTALEGRVGHVVCGLGVGQHLEYWGYDAERVSDLDWWETLELDGNTKIHMVPARHFSGRVLMGNPTLWGGYVIETVVNGEKYIIYISGDSGYGEHYKEIRKRFGNIDFAILENGQYNLRWSMIHTLPDQLLLEIEELGANVVMTYHHAKYKLSNHAWYEPLEQIYECSSGKDWRLLTPMIGEMIDLEHIPQTTEWWKL